MTRNPRSIENEDERIAYAITLLKAKTRRDTLLAALDVLKESPAFEAHPSLLALYSHFAKNGAKRDPGAFTRFAILQALRPIAEREDIPLLHGAVETYEFLPPDFKEDAILLRSAALVILNELDDELAGYHAARLLVDGFVDTMSGEPAVMAAKVLASQANSIPLYMYVMQSPDAAIQPEVAGECLRGLITLPESLVDGILKRFQDTSSGVIKIGLCDLLIQHEEGPLALDYLAEALADTSDPDLFHYLSIAMLSARNLELKALVINAARLETEQPKIQVFCDALSYFDTDPDLADLHESLRSRLR